MELDWERPENILDFRVFIDSFDKFLKGTELKIGREWPPALGGNEWHREPFLYALQTARWTFVASLYLLADSPADPCRHLEFTVAVPPLTRTILDMLFNFVFIFDDFQERLCWYLQSGLDETERMIKRFGDTYSGDPAWSPWLSDLSRVRKPFAMSRDRVCGKRNPPQRRFPHPGKIVRGEVPFKDPQSLDFLRYLNDWFYRDLSSSSHGHWYGLANRYAQILRVRANDEAQTKFARKHKSDCIFQQTTLLLCLASEVIAAAGFDNKPKARYFWGLLTGYWGEAKELYTLRYQMLLS